MTYYVAGMPYSAELYHHGIKGQKWGVRRFENSDGTLTAAGKERYYGHKSKSGMSDETKGKLKKAAKVAAITAGTALAAYGTYRLAKSGALDGVAQRMAERNEKNRVMKDRMEYVSSMHKRSTPELEKFLARLDLERKIVDRMYESQVNPASPRDRVFINAGKKIAETALAGAGLYGIKALLTKKMDPRDAANYITPKPKTK